MYRIDKSKNKIERLLTKLKTLQTFLKGGF
jgi:hypothetical protein